MASLNSVHLIGRAGKDPEVRQFEGGSKLAKFTLATDESYTDRNGQRQSATEWHNIVLNGKLADIAAQYIHKGSMLYVGGKIRTRSWRDQEGNDHYQTEIVGMTLQLLDPKPQAQAPAPAYQQAQAPQYPQAPQYAPAPQYRQAPAPAPQAQTAVPSPYPQYAPQTQPVDDLPGVDPDLGF